MVYDHSKFGQICMLDIEGCPINLTIVERDDTVSRFVLTNLRLREDFTEIPYPVHLKDRTVWEKARFVIRPDERTLVLEIAGKEIVRTEMDIAPSFRMNILFGGSIRSVMDTPDIAVRNIMVTGGCRSYFYPLDEVSGSFAYSDNGRRKGSVINPHWLTHDHYYWKELTEFRADKAAGVAFDPVSDRVIVTDRDSLKIFRAGANNKDGVLTVSALDSPLPYYGYSGEAVYDGQTESVLFYNFMDKAGICKPFVAGIELSGRTFYYSEPLSGNPRHHHAFAWIPQDHRLYVFGGYGNLEYCGDIVSYDPERNRWEEVVYSGDRISPRMHVVAGRLSEDEVLIFGGVGNSVGRQELGKEFYYDLYLFNVRNRTVKKLWEISEDSSYVPTRNIVVNDEKSVIYIFCRDREARSFLKSYDLATGKSEKVSAELFHPTNDILSSYYLFKSKDNDRFFLVNRHSDEEYSTVSVFSLDYPPVSLQHKGHKEMNAWIYMVMILSVVVLTVAAAVFFLIRRKRHDAVEDAPEVEYTAAPVPNSVLFFGEFTVIDRNGNDITSRFGFKIRQLLACLMLHTENYGGISTVRLTEALWPDRTPAEAKNVRGVSINHLRSLIADIDGIELVFDENRWKVIMDERLHWDYSAVMDLSEKVLADGPDKDEVANEFVGILSRGQLLGSFVSFAWFDNIKIDSEEKYYSVLNTLISSYYKDGKIRQTMLCADIMFSIDRFSEVALNYKVSCLKKIGKPELAHQLSHRFCEELKEVKNLE